MKTLEGGVRDTATVATLQIGKKRERDARMWTISEEQYGEGHKTGLLFLKATSLSPRNWSENCCVVKDKKESKKATRLSRI